MNDRRRNDDATRFFGINGGLGGGTNEGVTKKRSRDRAPGGGTGQD